MSRTVFVNPSFMNPSKKKAAKKGAGKKRKSRVKWKGAPRYSVRGKVSLARRNAGIAPFLQNPYMQNPLILAPNPMRKRRARRSNPSFGLPSVKEGINFGLSTLGGSTAALTANTVALSHIKHVWGRRGAQFAASVIGGGFIASKSPNMGGAFAGAMMYPLLQDLAADLLGVGFAAGAASKEADIDALAADLEDVLDDMDGGELSDDEDDEDYAW